MKRLLRHGMAVNRGFQYSLGNIDLDKFAELVT
jgi:hypothetical protein